MARWLESDAIPVSDDILDARTLPAHVYTDSAVLEREYENIFSESWQYAGSANELEEPGDYITCEAAGRSLFVIRHEDGDLRAYDNICPHRGTKILEASGNTSLVQCPYHSWTFDADGQLQNTPTQFDTAVRNPELDDEDVEGFGAEANSLNPVHVDTAGPFVFVSVASDPPPFAEVYEGVSEELDAYGLSDLRLAKHREVELDCNWKVMVGNYLECDHCHANHPSFVRSVDMEEYQIELDEYHSIQHGPVVEDGEKVGETRFYFLWPNTTINIYEAGTGCAAYRIEPIDHERTLLTADYYFESDEITDDRQSILDTSYQLQEEDFELVERQYEGLQSNAITQGRLGPNEHGVHHFHRLVQDHLEG